MIEIRLHGRGGQGGVTSAELLARAAIGQGRFAQAFPSFGPERRGAPVVAFVRVSDEQIRLREKISEPNIVLVLDPTLLDIVNVAEGGVKELILALGATLEAEATATSVRDLAAQVAPDVAVTRLAQGIPLGAEVKYMDRETLKQSLVYRQKL